MAITKTICVKCGQCGNLLELNIEYENESEKFIDDILSTIYQDREAITTCPDEPTYFCVLSGFSGSSECFEVWPVSGYRKPRC